MRGSRSIFAALLIFSVCLSIHFAQPALAQQVQRTHTVQPGETLFRIALTYGVTVEAMVAVNNLPDASHITVGQVLIIPGDAPPAQPAAPSMPNPSANPPAAPVYYVVQPGDTLNSISRAYGISVQAIMSANGLSDMNHIEVGQRLVLPGGTAPGSGATIPQQPPAAPSTPPQTAPPQTTQQLRTYVVQPGQGLADIARLFNVTWPAIAALNNITDPNKIYAGTVLKIPDSATSPATTMENSQGVPPGPIGASASGKSITVVLHEQRVYVYENGNLIRNVLVSTGLPGTPTVVGTFHIYVKYSSQLMTGPGYYLPGVPWVMYFYQGYSFHGTYWHHNWGHPMSHGCVNMPTDEALWLYQWADVGTEVNVVY